jgi:hypothetical protein
MNKGIVRTDFYIFLEKSILNRRNNKCEGFEVGF